MTDHGAKVSGLGARAMLLGACCRPSTVVELAARIRAETGLPVGDARAHSCVEWLLSRRLVYVADHADGMRRVFALTSKGRRERKRHRDLLVAAAQLMSQPCETVLRRP